MRKRRLPNELVRAAERCLRGPRGHIETSPSAFWLYIGDESVLAYSVHTTMTYDPKAIANFFIEVAAAEGKKLTPLQVIKLVYIAHGWHLGITGQPLINEPPQAWQYGPVIPSLYHSLKKYGNEKIPEPIWVFEGQVEGGISFKQIKVDPPAEPVLRSFLNSVWKAYSKFSGSQLSTMTHQPGTPWQRTWDELGAKNYKGFQIPEGFIREHYEKLRQERLPN